jgi:hypothetical protein
MAAVGCSTAVLAAETPGRRMLDRWTPRPTRETSSSAPSKPTLLVQPGPCYGGPPIMAVKKTTKKQSKSSFIRKQPASMSASEIMAAGKKAGMTISSSLVYMVRGRAGKAKKKAATAAASTTSTSPTTSKAEFVRSRQHLSPKEIVEDAKATGMKLDVGYVYNVRGADKKAGRKEMRTAARRSTERTAPPVARPIATSTKAEDLLRAVAAEVGLGRAIELLEAERARVHAVMRG